jgi:hypothetical protein
MGIRPIDMQVLIPNSQEIHPAKQSVVNKQDNELLMAQQQGRENASVQRQRVNTGEKTEFKRVNEDGEREKKKHDRQEAERSGSEETSDQEEKPSEKQLFNPLGSHFDMKV